MVSPRTRRFIQVDVFAPRAGAGNPLAVVFDAGDLDLAQMQAIAAWTDLAETTFVLPPSTPDADYRVRIFTTQKEIAFAGHPSIGTAHAVLATGLATPRDGGLLIQECQAGLLPVRVTQPGDRQTLSVRVPRSKIVVDDGAPAVLEQIVPATLRGALKPSLVEGGRRWWLAELADEAAVRSYQPDRKAILSLARDTNSLGLCVFARTSSSGDAGLVVRAFPLGVGIDEDPASGAANAAIAAFLDEAGALGTLGKRYLVSQGREIGRDASLELRIDEQHEVWVGGESQALIDGEMRW